MSDEETVPMDGDDDDVLREDDDDVREGFGDKDPEDAVDDEADGQ